MLEKAPYARKLSEQHPKPTVGEVMATRNAIMICVQTRGRLPRKTANDHFPGRRPGHPGEDGFRLDVVLLEPSRVVDLVGLGDGACCGVHEATIFHAAAQEQQRR